MEQEFVLLIFDIIIYNTIREGRVRSRRREYYSDGEERTVCTIVYESYDKLFDVSQQILDQRSGRTTKPLSRDKTSRTNKNRL